MSRKKEKRVHAGAYLHETKAGHPEKREKTRNRHMLRKKRGVGLPGGQEKEVGAKEKEVLLPSHMGLQGR